MSSPKNANIKKIILYLKVAKIDFACPSTDSKEVVYPLVCTMLVPSITAAEKPKVLIDLASSKSSKTSPLIFSCPPIFL